MWDYDSVAFCPYEFCPTGERSGRVGYLECWTGDRVVLGDWVRILLRQLHFGTLAIPSTPLCLSEETLKAVGPFYLVSMQGEVKDPTSLHWKCVGLMLGAHLPTDADETV